MGEAPNTAIAAILTIVIIFVIVLMVYFLAPNTFNDIMGIADEVFLSEHYAEEEMKTKTSDALTSLSDNLNDCAESEPTSCPCWTPIFGELPEDNFMYIENSYSESEETSHTYSITALTEKLDPIKQSKGNMVLGLFVMKQNSNGVELGCVYPDNYYIIADDSIGRWFDGLTENTWYVKWKDSPFGTGEYPFYRDLTWNKDIDLQIQYDEHLKEAPVLYKLEDDRYCLLTTMIEYEKSDDFSAYHYETILDIGEKYKEYFSTKIFTGGVAGEALEEFFSGEYCSNS